MGFIGAQRFYLNGIYSFTCLLCFLLSFFYYRKNNQVFYSLLFISIFLSVDYGGKLFNVTPVFLRYSIILTAIIAMIRTCNFYTKKLLIVFGLTSFFLLLTILNQRFVSFPYLQRDILIIVLFSVVFMGNDKFNMDLKLICITICGYCISEYLNIILFHNYFTDGYLNLDSTKSILLLPMVIFLVTNRVLYTFLYLAFIVPIFLVYGTRMLFFSISIIFLTALIKLTTLKRFMIYVANFLLLITIIFEQINKKSDDSNIKNYRLISSLFESSENDGFFTFIKALDPIRYDENIMFFERDLFSVIFGSGLGSGIYDENNRFRNISSLQPAFPKEELDSNIFYGFHDIWTDVGIRFGIISVLLYYYYYYSYPSFLYFCGNNCCCQHKILNRQ